MPFITAGNVISDAAQLGAGVVKSTAILDGEIVNADINAAAAIDGSKLQALSVGANAGVIPSTGVDNNHVKAAAGIVDTKLATISTAGKVEGAALTLLANVPAGAGVLPVANTPGVPPVIALSATDVTVTNTTADTNLLSVSIPGGTLGTANGIKATLFFSSWQTGASTDVALKIKYGGTTLHTFTFVASATTPGQGKVEVWLIANAATNVQQSFAIVDAEADVLTASTTRGASHHAQSIGTAAEDSTAAKNFVVSIDPVSAQGNEIFTMTGYVISKL